jgi:hypothetical protein
VRQQRRTAQNNWLSMPNNMRIKGLDLDEWPPAMTINGGNGATIMQIPYSDNRDSGACMGNQIVNLPDWTELHFEVVE